MICTGNHHQLAAFVDPPEIQHIFHGQISILLAMEQQHRAVIGGQRRMFPHLLVKFIDGNTKRQNQDGSFMNNGHSDRVPPQPMFPGYSDTYKRAVAK